MKWNGFGLCSAFGSEILTKGGENIVNENGSTKTGEKDPKSNKRESEREAVETRDEAEGREMDKCTI